MNPNGLLIKVFFYLVKKIYYILFIFQILKVQVFSGDNQKSYIFCPSKPFLEEGQLTRFNRC